mmetsp:Transcript_60820/g.98467  ORF Transcript_60820/g.98467 Transcript_60820/m.98467 type:complete len:506 (-) Transcript_60820:816-2333(-)
MAELDLRREARGAGAHAPGHDWLGDATLLHGLDEVVLVHAAHFAQEHQHLCLIVVLVAQEVVQEAAARVAITSDSDALVHAVSLLGNHVVELVGHASGLGDVGHGAGAVEPRHDDVVQHAAGVANTQATWLDASHGGGTNESHAICLSDPDDVLGLLLWNALSNDGHGLHVWVVHGLHGSLVHGAEGSKVHEDRDVGVLLNSLLGGSVDRHQNLVGAPVELHVVVAGEGEDHGFHGRLLALAHEVKVQHALDRPVLQTIDDTGGLWGGGDEGVLRASWGLWVNLRVRLPARHVNHLPLRRAAGLREVGLRKVGDEAQGHWDHCCDVRLGAVDLEAEPELVAGGLHLAQTLQVVGPSTADADLDLVLLDLRGVVLQGLDEAGEGGCDIREVCDAATDDQELAIWVLVLQHQRQQGLGVHKGLLGGRSAGVLAIICQLVSPAVVCHGVCVDHRGAAASHHGPHTTLVVEDGQLERGASPAVHVADQGLLWVGGTAEWWRPVNLAPLG